MPKTIWIMRHAENHKDESRGLALTEEGIRKTHELGARLAAFDTGSPTLIISTSSERGSRTGVILREEFQKSSKIAFAATNDRIGSNNVADTIQIVNMITQMKEACAASQIPVPDTLILIMHKQNELLPIFSSLLDTSAYFRGYSTPSDASLTLEGISELAANLNDDELAAHFGAANEELGVPNFLDALRFDMRVNEWSDFGYNCAQFRQKLEIA